MPLSYHHPWAFERGTLWARECDGNGDGAVLVAPKIRATLGEVYSEAADELATAMGFADSAQALRRFGGGRRCFVARVDGSIATYGWVSRGVERIGELERTLRMAPAEAYIWDCATLPHYRGQRLYCALLSHIAATLCHDGAQRLWIGAALSNAPSIRGFAAAGFQPVLRLTYLRLLGVRHLQIVGAPTAPPELVVRARASLGVATPVKATKRASG